MDLGLKGKTALVTGGSKGIGRAVAQSLAAEGARVMICSRDAETLKQAAADVERATGGRVEVLSADLSTPAECTAVCQSCCESASTRCWYQLRTFSGAPPQKPSRVCRTWFLKSLNCVSGALEPSR